MLASAIIGGMIGSQFYHGSDGGFFGVLGGMFAFACARLWASPSKTD
jgi:hypothetical protein